MESALPSLQSEYDAYYSRLVALVLGGFTSVLAVFLMEYWRSPRKQSATG